MPQENFAYTKLGYLSWFPGKLEELAQQEETLYFDAIQGESVELASDVFEHPVQDGPNISDYARQMPRKVTLRCLVSNTPSGDIPAFPLELNRVNFELPVSPNRTLFGIIGRMFTGNIPATKASGALVYQPVGASDTDRVSLTEEILEDLKNGRQLLTVHTSQRDYPNMQIAHIRKDHDDSSDAAAFVIDFQEIRIAERKTIAAPVPAETRGNPAKNKGTQTVKQQDPKGSKKSTLAQLRDAGKKYLGKILKGAG